MSSLREETRDRLLSPYDCPPPRPMGVMPLSVFRELMYQFASTIGYDGSRDDAERDFLSALNGGGGSGGLSEIIVRLPYADFPRVGNANKFYYEINTKAMYIWMNDDYVQINTPGLKENTILFGGEVDVPAIES